MNSKDLDIIHHTLRYCEQTNETCNEFDNSKEQFDRSATFRNAVCLCLLQIGELVTILSDEFKSNHPEIQWREIKLLRNIVAHRYGQIDYEIIWQIILADIPELIDFCKKILSEQESQNLEL
ncbi:MAG: DUF86 domain-containing protein [Oscillospiraceae bacterium]|nr:DUF86 domain-containing protein [Oscillospiraceae bacterium]